MSPRAVRSVLLIAIAALLSFWVASWLNFDTALASGPTVKQAPTPCSASGVTSVSCSLANTTTGNLLLACGQVNTSSSNAITSVTSTGATFVDSGTGVVFGSVVGSIQCYLAKNITGETTPSVTANWASAAGAHVLHPIEISGINTATPIDNLQVFSNTTASANPSVSVTTTNATDMLFGFAQFQSTTTVGSGFTQIQNTGSSLSEYKNESSTGTYTITISENNVNLTGSIIGIALAGTGGGGSTFIPQVGAFEVGP